MAIIFMEEKRSRSWSEIAYDFFDIVRIRMSDAVRRQRMRFIRIASTLVFLTIGVLFVLVGMALFVGDLINNSSWSGYLSVGIVLIIIGALLPKK